MDSENIPSDFPFLKWWSKKNTLTTSSQMLSAVYVRAQWSLNAPPCKIVLNIDLPKDKKK